MIFLTMKTNWQTKKFKIDIALIVFGTILVVIIFESPQFFAQLNLLALLATLAVLIWYAYDTHRIADQTIESSLRPLILRSGFIESWESVKFSIKARGIEGRPLEFSILKNIAKDISGYIIINNKQYQLLFANHISSKDVKEELSDLEKHILVYLYEHYKVSKKNLPQNILEVHKNLSIGEGEYMGIINDSKYVKTTVSEYTLTDDGIRLLDADKPIEYRFEPNWGWMNAGTIINAIFENDKYKEDEGENQIYVTYSDMEGNKYFTKENKNFSQNSGRL